MAGIEPGGARVVITGAGSGIGEATARRFAAEGARVVAVDIDGEAVERVATECGSSAEARTCDVADYEAVAALARGVEESGPIDILVNNAGVGVAGPLLETEISDWEWLRSINLDGVAHGCYAFAPAMVERGRGQVVNVSSGAAYIPQRHMASYCAAKAGVYSLSQCLRADWRRFGVGVSVICPGVIATPIAANTRFRGSTTKLRDRANWALSKGHSPDLVARAIVAAARRNRAVVPVGIESKLAYWLLRPAPQPIQGLFARTPI